MRLSNRVINGCKAAINGTVLENIFLRCRDFFRKRRYRKKYAKVMNNGTSLKEIEVISIEFCAVCNISCRYCFLERGERPSFLSIDLYKKLLSEICGNSEYQIKIMEWPISGCFFLHPDYRQVIELTEECKLRHSNFSPWVILNDNMMLFDKDKVDLVLGREAVNQIICSIDGVDKETFERMRPNADFDTVVENTH